MTRRMLSLGAWKVTRPALVTSLNRADLEMSDTIDFSDKIDVIDDIESPRLCFGFGTTPAENDPLLLRGAGGADLRLKGCSGNGLLSRTNVGWVISRLVHKSAELVRR